jgi:hypothetical protein
MRRGSSRHTVAAALAGILAFAAIGAVVSPALGGPDFLTLNKAKRIFITKGAANRRFLPARGQLKLQVGDTEWVTGAGSGAVTYFADAVQLTDPSTDCGLAGCALIAAPDIPLQLLGRHVRVQSFQLCYAANADATLEDVGLVKQTTTTPPPPTPAFPIDDNTSRTDSACRTYRAAHPLKIGAADDIKLDALVNFANDSAKFLIFRTTLNLSIR